MNTRPLSKLLVSRPRLVLLVLTIITALVGVQIQNIYMVNNLTSYLPDDNPGIQLWNQIEEEFDLTTSIIVFVQAPDIRDYEVLNEMDRVIQRVNIYELDAGKNDGISRVQSITELIRLENSAPWLPGGLGGQGINEVPDDDTLIARYLARSSLAGVKGVLYDDSFTSAAMIFSIYDADQSEETMASIKQAIDVEARYSEMSITGMTALQEAVKTMTLQYMALVLPIAVALISSVVFFFQRSFRAIIIVLLPLAYALILTFGFLGVVLPEMTILSIAVVALLIGLGVDYSIHILNRYSEERMLGDKVEIVDRTLRLTGKAVLLSTITTLIGFGSLMVSSMPPITYFGFSCAVGIVFCFITAILMVPCLAIILKFERKGEQGTLKAAGRAVTQNKYRVIFVAAFISILSFVVLPSIETDVNYYDMVPEGMEEFEVLEEYASSFGGGTNYNLILIETNPQGLTYPETIDAIYNLQEEIKTTGASVNSIVGTIKEVNDVLTRNEIIERLAEIADAQEIVFDMVAENGLVDEQYSKTVLMVTMPVGLSTIQITEIIEEINAMSKNASIPHGGQIYPITGTDSINADLNMILTDEQTRSMIVSLLLVLAALILIFGSSKWGILTMVPVAFVLAWEPSFLMALNIELSVVTISIASIMIGIGIDYSIHVSQRIREEMDEGKTKREAIEEAIDKTGTTLIEAAMTTVFGTLSIMFVPISAIREFAILILVMVLASLVASVFLSPVFISLGWVKKGD